ncbi:hypothetical protein PI125_g25825 [Phytophthora idaei]|nr:hypothetical protein PI125_g25825 [Phytophthora idaei]
MAEIPWRHGPPPKDGLAILADCLQQMCALESKRRAAAHEPPRAFGV